MLALPSFPHYHSVPRSANAQKVDDVGAEPRLFLLLRAVGTIGVGVPDNMNARGTN